MDKIKCFECRNNPIYTLENNRQLCNNHFISYFEKKVFSTIRKFNLLGKSGRIGIALSGGKDSITALYLLNRIIMRNPKMQITAIMVDEGIKSSGEKTRSNAISFCKKEKIDLHIYSFSEEYGIALDDILKRLSSKADKANPCTICGILRRRILNSKARDLGLDCIATGHNLDDETQSILMNQLRKNVLASAKLGPVVGVKKYKRFVQRIKPLYLCPEKEVMLYSMLKGFAAKKLVCKYRKFAFRKDVCHMLDDFEQKHPGIKNNIINSFMEILPLLKKEYKNKKIRTCSRCGEVSSNDVCNVCKLIEKIKE
ncbi:MAG: TIGR00269 family protein [Nanoarchaeota archaeon]|nr:TIGR00269 family protein [Nanoarchaeota archaeon]